MSTLLRSLSLVAFAVSCVSLAPVVTAAEAGADISGEWTFEVEIAGNVGTPTFTFKQDGEKLTGQYQGQFGEAEVKGTLKGKDVEFSFEVQPGANAVYKGELDGETMKGTCDYAGQADGDWTAKRKEKE